MRKYDIAKFVLPESTINCKEDFSIYNGEGTLLRKVQKRSLEMMIELDRICRKYDIPYWLAGGTLIGAVRHQGFIPWDDDIDVHIVYSDIPRLRKALQNELPEQFVYQDWTTDNKYFLPSVVKIRDRKSYFPIPVYKGFKEQGLLVDLVPFEKMPSIRFRRFVFNLNKYPYLWRKDISIKGTSDFKFIGGILSPIAYLVTNFAHFWSKYSKTKRWRLNYLFVMNNAEHLDFDESEIFPLKEAEFEGRRFLVPNESVKYLKKVYGDDVLEIPPESKRTTHSPNVFFYD